MDSQLAELHQANAAIGLTGSLAGSLAGGCICCGSAQGSLNASLRAIRAACNAAGAGLALDYLVGQRGEALLWQPCLLRLP